MRLQGSIVWYRKECYPCTHLASALPDANAMFGYQNSAATDLSCSTSAVSVALQSFRACCCSVCRADSSTSCSAFASATPPTGSLTGSRTASSSASAPTPRAAWAPTDMPNFGTAHVGNDVCGVCVCVCVCVCGVCAAFVRAYVCLFVRDPNWTGQPV